MVLGSLSPQSFLVSASVSEQQQGAVSCSQGHHHELCIVADALSWCKVTQTLWWLQQQNYNSYISDPETQTPGKSQTLEFT
jgi:hypothetical protein